MRSLSMQSLSSCAFSVVLAATVVLLRCILLQPGENLAGLTWRILSDERAAPAFAPSHLRVPDRQAIGLPIV